jgi:hypothetical protein
MVIKTANFHPDTDPKLLCTCGHPDCDQRSVSQSVLNMAQGARHLLGHGLSVTSGGRCPNHPNEIQRTTPADHQKSSGIDISVNGSTRGNVVAAGLEVGFNAIGVAKTFVHWGYRPELPAGHITMWVYS